MSKRTVWKFTAPVTDKFAISMPSGAKLLSAGVQGNNLCIWALVDPEGGLETRNFRLAGTGHPITEHVHFLETIQMHDGALVFHLFECEPFAPHIPWGYGS
jgi:hypothetical protein